MRIDRIRPLAAFASLCFLFACASDGSAKSSDDAQRQAAAKQGAQMAQGVNAPPADAPGKPGYLQPRADGTYVDAKGNILTPPPVMLGVTMEQPGKALVKHMGINPARTTLLIDVIPGLPAAKAGLEDHDLVIAVDGSQDASPSDIRRKLKAMKAGDRITFTVRRGAESRTVTLTAASWQAEHMVRPLHAGSFAKPNLNDAAERDSAPREMQPVMDRLDRIEKQLQQLSNQSNTALPPAAPAAPAAAPAAPSTAPAKSAPAPATPAAKPVAKPTASAAPSSSEAKPIATRTDAQIDAMTMPELMEALKQVSEARQSYTGGDPQVAAQLRDEFSRLLARYKTLRPSGG